MAIPDVVGELLWDAAAELDGLTAGGLALGDPGLIAAELGVDEIDDPADYPALDTYRVYKTDPAAGERAISDQQITIYVKAAAPTGAEDSVWQAKCTDPETDEVDVIYTLKNVWKRVKTDGVYCNFELQPDKNFKPTSDEQNALKVANDDKPLSGDDAIKKFVELLDQCIAFYPDSNYNGRRLLQAAAMICPDAPDFKAMKAWQGAKSFEDGSYEIGEEVAPGTYRTVEAAKDCYWERSTPHGDTIANNFITFASEGASVTVKPGESLTTSGCGEWTKR